MLRAWFTNIREYLVSQETKFTRRALIKRGRLHARIAVLVAILASTGFTLTAAVPAQAAAPNKPTQAATAKELAVL